MVEYFGKLLLHVEHMCDIDVTNEEFARFGIDRMGDSANNVNRYVMSR